VEWSHLLSLGMLLFLVPKVLWTKHLYHQFQFLLGIEWLTRGISSGLRRSSTDCLAYVCILSWSNERHMPSGEQQRVAFLRLLLHCPKLAFLDEATGALDTPTEAALYTALRSHCSTFVSVGGRFRFPLHTSLDQEHS
jgi:ABC-type uncharacterized transport system fused permease/ATPase subunit